MECQWISDVEVVTMKEAGDRVSTIVPILVQNRANLLRPRLGRDGLVPVLFLVDAPALAAIFSSLYEHPPWLVDGYGGFSC